MGYTHYWHVADDVSGDAWTKFRDFTEKAADLTPATIVWDESNTNGYQDVISFNGDESKGEDHETFHVNRTHSGFDFCKTALKPYDELVVACCIAGKALGVFASWSSDGSPEEHQSGQSIFDSIYPNGVAP
jgi:hypothetical protein